MRYLLDTHILLWLLEDSSRVSVTALEKLRTAEVIYVSAVTIWEITIKKMSGKLKIEDGLLANVARSGFKELPISWENGYGIGELKLPHGDPFDRLLLTQARQDQLTLVTMDRVLLKAQPALCLDARR
jgi:PIN domain nuclease of toxin-antitoxin system